MLLMTALELMLLMSALELIVLLMTALELMVLMMALELMLVQAQHELQNLPVYNIMCTLMSDYYIITYQFALISICRLLVPCVCFLLYLNSED